MLERVRKVLQRGKLVDTERRIQTIQTKDGYVVLKISTYHYTCNCPDFNGMTCQHVNGFITERLSQRTW